MVQPDPNKKPEDSWLVELVRLTGFPSPSLQIDSSEWWPKIVGEPAESQLVQPKKGISRQEGPFGTGRLILETQPARIDWILMKKLPDDEALGESSVVFKQFDDLVSHWFEMSGSLQRLAFGSILSLPVQSRCEGYERLSYFLKGVQIDPENSSDFLYQINRPRMSDADGFQIKLNRLSKWSVNLWQTRQISSVSDRLIASAFACGLELDLNTDAEFAGELPGDSLRKILDLLIEFALEITQRGDVP